MQPYFCAYIGYYQLIHSVDKFVICDNMQYTKKGWFNRNRILDSGTDRTFTIPLKKDKSYANVNLRYLADNSIRERIRILKQIQHFYKKAPFYSSVWKLTAVSNTNAQGTWYQIGSNRTAIKRERFINKDEFISFVQPMRLSLNKPLELDFKQMDNEKKQISENVPY